MFLQNCWRQYENTFTLKCGASLNTHRFLPIYLCTVSSPPFHFPLVYCVCGFRYHFRCQLPLGTILKPIRWVLPDASIIVEGE